RPDITPHKRACGRQSYLSVLSRVAFIRWGCGVDEHTPRSFMLKGSLSVQVDPFSVGRPSGSRRSCFTICPCRIRQVPPPFLLSFLPLCCPRFFDAGPEFQKRRNVVNQQQFERTNGKGESLVISRTDDGFRVYAAADPANSYIVGGGPDEPTCT